MDYADLFRQAIAKLEKEPSLVHGEEFRTILIDWLTWCAESFDTGTWTGNARVVADPEASPGIRMARLLTKGRGDG